MIRPLAFAALALLALAPATAADGPDELPPPPVSRWETLPRLAYQPDFQPRAVWIDRAKALDGKEDCHLAADDKGVVRLSVPFVVLLGPDGTVKAAHAEMPECPAMATLIEQFAHQLGPKTVVPPESDPDLWRASHFLAGWQK